MAWLRGRWALAEHPSASASCLGLEGKLRENERALSPEPSLAGACAPSAGAFLKANESVHGEEEAGCALSLPCG